MGPGSGVSGGGSVEWGEVHVDLYVCGIRWTQRFSRPVLNFDKGLGGSQALPPVALVSESGETPCRVGQYWRKMTEPGKATLRSPTQVSPPHVFSPRSHCPSLPDQSSHPRFPLKSPHPTSPPQVSPPTCSHRGLFTQVSHPRAHT